MVVVIFWLLFALLVGALAHSRGRGRWRWTFLSVLISPIIAGLMVLILNRRN